MLNLCALLSACSSRAGKAVFSLLMHKASDMPPICVDCSSNKIFCRFVPLYLVENRCAHLAFWEGSPEELRMRTWLPSMPAFLVTRTLSGARH